MEGATDLLPPTPDDRSRPGLEFVHLLLVQGQTVERTLEVLLRDLATALGAAHAGLADLGAGTPLARTGSTTPPWVAHPELLRQVAKAPAGVALRYGGASWLAAAAEDAEGAGCLLWLEADEARGWTTAEAGILALAAQMLAQRGARPEDARRARQAAWLRREQQMEQAAAATRRVAHDYGNILTGILGFTELIQAELPEDHPLAPHLAEVYRAAQAGAHLTNQLRLYSRRSWPACAGSKVATALAAEERRLRDKFGEKTRLEILLPADLPPVAVGVEPLRSLLAPLLDNAVEAAESTVRVTARPVTLGPDDCADLIGTASPGAYVEVAVEDDGAGLEADVVERLLTEPFFSTKPRRGGLGLGVTRGILHCHRGGLALAPGPAGGTAARVWLPVGTATPGKSAAGAGRVLVVDDDPMILQFVCTTLERAGYLVQAAGGGDEALRRYAEAKAEPFHLVLADVLMPRMTGFDLARALQRQDAGVNFLFMSGEAGGELSRSDVPGSRFALLAKPFRPEGLLRAVRAALERGTRRLPAAGLAGRGGSASSTTKTGHQ